MSISDTSITDLQVACGSFLNTSIHHKKVHPRDDNKEEDETLCDLTFHARPFHNQLLIDCDSHGSWQTPKAQVRVGLMEPLNISVITGNKHLKKIQESSKNQESSGDQDPLIAAICVATSNNVYNATMLARMVEFLMDQSPLSKFQVREDSELLPPITRETNIIVYLSPSTDLTNWVAAGGVLVGTLEFKPAEYQFDFGADYYLRNKTQVVLMQVGKLTAVLENSATAAADKLNISYLSKHLDKFLK